MKIRIPKIVEKWLMNLNCQSATPVGETPKKSGVSITQHWGTKSNIIHEIHSFWDFLKHLCKELG